MPIERFRRVEEMPGAAPVEDPEERLDRLDELCRVAQMLSAGAAAPRGVQRFESVSQANEARDEMLARRMREKRKGRDT